MSGGVAPTVGAALAALAVLAAVMAFVSYTGGMPHVKTVQLAPSQQATAERLLGRRETGRQG